jgi:predicted pyridoxine 5'-phosphate oxidase superfamily flavin-nucleotide-binding protein
MFGAMNGALLVLMALATGASHDSHTMTAAEHATFLPLACRNAVDDPKRGAHCSKLIGNPSGPENVADFSLTAIVYGSLTRAGADQAYVSYFTMAEPHADNFGGGILFERSKSGWTLIHWYPGGQMERCVAVPGGARQKMLCLSGFLQEGELSSTVAVQALSNSGGAATPQEQTAPLITVDDTRNESSFPSAPGGRCGILTSYESSVVDIDTLTRATKPGFFAESEVTYVTQKEWYDACRTQHYDKIEGKKATVRYAVKNGRVTFESPIAIKPPSS